MTEGPPIPARWTLEALLAAPLQRPVVWAGRSVEARVRAALPWPLAAPLSPLPAGTGALVVVGGGTLIDEAKAFRAQQAPGVTLVAVPALWGSGAEASPVTVLTRGGKKQITVDARWLPDARVVWPALLEGVPEARARAACGDAWAHAWEGFLSPLATPALRAEGASLLAGLLALPLAADARWLDASAAACALQARSSVGLVHGLAHALEGPLREEQPEAGWGHARLCATLLWPVLAFNRQAGQGGPGPDKAAAHCAAHGVDLAAVERTQRALFDAGAWRSLLPALERLWPQVLRDPCTRTNCALVRPASLSFFTSFTGGAA